MVNSFVARTLPAMGSRMHKLQYLQHVGSAVVVPGLETTASILVVHGLHVRSSRARDRTRVSSIGKQILYH